MFLCSWSLYMLGIINILPTSGIAIEYPKSPFHLSGILMFCFDFPYILQSSNASLWVFKFLSEFWQILWSNAYFLSPCRYLVCKGKYSREWDRWITLSCRAYIQVTLFLILSLPFSTLQFFFLKVIFVVQCSQILRAGLSVQLWLPSLLCVAGSVS